MHVCLIFLSHEILNMSINIDTYGLVFFFVVSSLNNFVLLDVPMHMVISSELLLSLYYTMSFVINLIGQKVWVIVTQPALLRAHMCSVQ